MCDIGYPVFGCLTLFDQAADDARAADNYKRAADIVVREQTPEENDECYLLVAEMPFTCAA